MKKSARNGKYIGNKRTKELHIDSCNRLPSEENRTFFGSIEDAIGDGYNGCYYCLRGFDADSSISFVPTIIRTGDSAKQAGSATNIRIIPGDENFFVTACRTDEGNLKLISWELNDDGSITRKSTPEMGKAGPISEVSLILAVGYVITSVRTDEGNLKLIVWSVSTDGKITRKCDSGKDAGRATMIRSVWNGKSECVITSVRDDSGCLKLITWKIKNLADGQVEIIRKDDSGKQAGEIDDNDLMYRPYGALSAVRTASGTLKLIAWKVSREGIITRIGDSGTEGEGIPSSSMITLCKDPLSGPNISAPIVTAVRTQDGILKIITWADKTVAGGKVEITREGDNSPLLQQPDLKVSEITVIKDRDNQIVTAVRTTNDVEGVRLIRWRVEVDGSVLWKGDSGNQTGPASHIDFTGNLKGTEEAVVCCRTSSGMLKLISWGIKPLPEWTFLVYMAGDNSIEGAGIDDIGEMGQAGGSGDKINVVVQFDRIRGYSSADGDWTTTKRFYIMKKESIELESLGETNCGDPTVLEEFLLWGFRNFPAKHYTVILWNHGSGWKLKDVYQLAVDRVKDFKSPNKKRSRDIIYNYRFDRARRILFDTTILGSLVHVSRGIAYDDTNQDFLDNQELENVLSSVTQKINHRIDILGMDACLMAMVEVAYQNKDFVDYIVASEDSEPYEGWPYDSIIKLLNEKPSLDPEKFSADIVKLYMNSYINNSSATQSSIKTTLLEDLAKGVDDLAESLIRNIEDYEVKIRRIYNEVISYSENDFVDLRNFAELVKKYISNEGGRAGKVIDLVNKAVVEVGGKGGGISIYLPQEVHYDPYGYNALYWASATRWDEFINACLERNLGSEKRSKYEKEMRNGKRLLELPFDK